MCMYNNFKNYKIFKKISINETNINQKTIYVNDEDYDIFTNKSLVIQDPVLNGSTLFHPILVNSINELPYFKNERLHIQLKDESKLIGRLISIEYKNTTVLEDPNSITVELEELCQSKIPTIYKNKYFISILTEKIQSFILLDNNTHICKNSNINNAIKIILNNDKDHRDIIISYDIPFISPSSIFALPNKPYNIFNNIIECDIKTNNCFKTPISFKTVYTWFSKWDITKEGVELIIVSNVGNERYTIKNFKCFKNHLIQTTVNEFKSKITSAALAEVPHRTTLQHAIYFNNNSDFSINKLHNIKIINNNQTLLNNKQEYYLFDSIKPNEKGVIVLNNYENVFNSTTYINDIPFRTKDPKPSQPNRAGVCHGQIKASKDYSLFIATNTIKSSYIFINTSNHKTRLIVYANSFSSSSRLSSNGKEISSNCFLYNLEQCSINTIKITKLIEKTFVAKKLSKELIKLLKENNIDVNLENKDESYCISYLNEDVRKRVIASLILNDKDQDSFKFSNTLNNDVLFSTKSYQKQCNINPSAKYSADFKIENKKKSEEDEDGYLDEDEENIDEYEIQDQEELLDDKLQDEDESQVTFGEKNKAKISNPFPGSIFGSQNKSLFSLGVTFGTATPSEGSSTPAQNNTFGTAKPVTFGTATSSSNT
ncbi:hypothetical protein DICPUDRAFT_74167 [Dictyostelium purpureum]|uniref:Uncharacterized protein n=1 Tax=Dictyostelium purpureum TaxID=5786 RepID=F0Z6Z3_DICPU|nr:uncharacterized protein DICPUDRAFT_74167 [Dictyostelium purpureum]EGC40290.1 hypothetical protein DICPUDRAFT_74167 [Dictyostelium purpureum]|eukprot:XP_003283226.1 hypothetical protein DICPUDRAFT_74167 [Dictyostelium purpureum]